MQEMTIMKGTPLSFGYMNDVEWVNLVLLVHDLKLLLSNIYVTFNFLFSYLSLSFKQSVLTDDIGILLQ